MLASACELEGDLDLALQLNVANRFGRGIRVVAVMIALRVFVEILKDVGQGLQLVARVGVADLANDHSEGIGVSEEVAAQNLAVAFEDGPDLLDNIARIALAVVVVVQQHLALP